MHQSNPQSQPQSTLHKTLVIRNVDGYRNLMRTECVCEGILRTTASLFVARYRLCPRHPPKVFVFGCANASHSNTGECTPHAPLSTDHLHHVAVTLFSAWWAVCRYSLAHQYVGLGDQDTPPAMPTHSQVDDAFAFSQAR